MKEEKGGFLEEKMYEISEELIGDHPPIHSKLGAESRIDDLHNEQENEDWCEKIVKDAKIRPPKKVKPDDPSKKAAKKNDKGKGKQTEKRTRKQS